MSKHAIIYTRFSPRPNAGECASCADQKVRCRIYCSDKGYDVYKTFDDEAVSGGILNRPGLIRAIAHLQFGWALVVDRPDRLSRELLDTLLIRRQVAEKKAEIIFADGSPSGAGSPEEVFFSNVMAAMAAYERDRIVHRCKKGKERSRKEGKFCGGKLKIGWAHDPSRPGGVIRHRAEYDAIVYICKWAGEYSSGFIAERVTEKYGPCRGEPWSARTVRKIIARESYWAGPDGDLPLEPTHP